MGKFKSLITGTLLGAGSMYVGMQYHVLMAPEGFLMVPRTPQHRLQDAYADVRTWDAKAWATRPQLSLAVTEHGRTDLIGTGVTQGVLDKLRNSMAPLQEQLGEVSQGWEPADTSEIPDPIVDRHRAEPVNESLPTRRGFLPLADLFGFGADKTERNVGRSILPENGSRIPVLPTATSAPPEVEFLPSPDDMDLGAPGQMPGRHRIHPRQSEVDDLSTGRRADSQQGWEPLSLLPQEASRQGVVR